MMFVRGLFWASLAVGVGPELIVAAKAEPRSAIAAEVIDTVAPTVRLVPISTTSATAAPTTDQVAAAPAKPVAPPKPAITLQAKIDLTRQTLTVSEHGKVVGSWKISSGVSAEFATPRGVFAPEWMSKMWYSKKYDDAPMPHAVFFKGGAAIHATQAVGRLGTPASHGCVRLAPGNAETFYKLVQRHGIPHTQISVYGNPAYPQYIASTTSSRRTTSASNNSVFGSNSGYAGWGNRPRSVQYASAGPFGGQTYARLPISAARVR